MRALSVAFTGHRPESLPCGNDMDSEAYFNLQTLVWKEIIRYIDAGCKTFYCGAARGADIMCGEIILAEKTTKHPDIQLICAIPFREQAHSWEDLWKMRYYDLLRDSDRIVQLCDNYQRGCYHIRNRYMVDNCDILIAIYNGETKGGTAYTVNYARKLGKEIVIIDPNSLTINIIPAMELHKG